MLNSIQGLRAVAALMVVCVHLAFFDVVRFVPWSLWGHGGVDIFFVISGFVMVWTTQDKAGATGAFFLHRIIRVVPLYWLLTLAIFLAALVIPGLLRVPRGLSDLAYSLFFIPYVGGNGMTQPILFPGWTLNYEMFFYLLFGCSLHIKDVRARVWTVAGALAALVLAGRIWDGGTIWTFYTSPLVLEFAFGMMAALYHRQIMALPSAATAVAAVLGVGGIVLSASLGGLNEWRGLSFGIPAWLIFVAVLRSEGRSGVLESKAMLLLGAASYALYLTHPFALRIIEAVAHHLGLVEGGGMLIAMAAATMAVLAIGILTHWWVEMPMHRFIRRLLPRRAKSGG